jgi:hypothetical protein
VPIGYSSSHYTGDTTAIAGLVLEDSNFNFENGVEGSGSDRLQYRIKVPDAEGVYSAMVKIHYQSLPPRWMEEMFTYDAEEITFFKEMYEAADPTPVLVWEGSTDFTNSVDVLTELESISIGPNPCQGVVRVRGAERCRVRIFNATGELVSESELALDGMVNLPPTQGVYYLQLISKGRVSKMEKVLRL